MKKLWLALAFCTAASLVQADIPGPVELPVSLAASGGSVQGSLLLPPSTGRMPVVLLIAGSGPTDRDGNSKLLAGHNDSLRLLAQALAEAGFASLRYDKRGIAASAAGLTRETDVRFETYVQDAAAWVRQLAADPRFSAVAIAGHSEGALVGMVAAQQSKVPAFVSIAGAGRGSPQLLRAQLAGRLPPELAERNEQILRELEAGRTVDDVPPKLAALYRPSVQPYLISQFKYVPTAEIAKLAMPVAIFQGDTDIQVTVSDAQMLAQARPSAELHVIAGMNHVLKVVPPDRQRQLSSYGDPTLPLAPGLAPQLTAFLRSVLPANAPP